MGAGFGYRNLGILRYSRRHVNAVIGDFRPRPASASPITAKLLRCDWLGRIGLPLTRAVRHLAAHPSGSDRWLHRPRWVGWLVRYLDIYLFYVYDRHHGNLLPGPILSVFFALIVHYELKSVHPGFPVEFIF